MAGVAAEDGGEAEDGGAAVGDTNDAAARAGEILNDVQQRVRLLRRAAENREEFLPPRTEDRPGGPDRPVLPTVAAYLHAEEQDAAE